MIVNIKSMIERCMHRMRRGACETCDHREACVAAKWQQSFAFAGGGQAPARQASRPAFPAFLLELAAALGLDREQSKPERRSRDFTREVELQLEALLAGGDVGIGRIAREMGLSRQTLYRRLKAEGTTFEQVLDSLRHRLALRYMRRGMSVKQAAYALGFAEPASFSRAFKRWTGRSPSAGH
jgi:AraC-like DNA-binding protein